MFLTQEYNYNLLRTRNRGKYVVVSISATGTNSGMFPISSVGRALGSQSEDSHIRCNTDGVLSE